MKRKKSVIRLQTKITLLVCGVVAIALLVTEIFINSIVATETQQSLADKALTIARIVARSNAVTEALSTRRNPAEIQVMANDIRRETHVEFIVVMDMRGIRLSHPDPEEVGRHFVGGDEKDVLAGREYISEATGTLGPSLRAFTPVYSPGGQQIGAVSVGILLDKVQHVVNRNRLVIYWAVFFGLLVGVAGAVLLARNIKKALSGLEPLAFARLLEERSAMLQSVREGIMAVDETARITLVNEEALRLLKQAGIHGEPVGKKVEFFVPNTRLSDVLKTGQAELDQEQDLNGIQLLTNRVPVCVDGEIVGVIATFRDKTEIKQLAEQLTGVRNYAEALRAQTHEFMNKLHVILGMVRLQCYDQLADYINKTAQQYQTEVGYVARRVKDPVIAGFLLGKLSYARESGVDLVLSDDSFLPEPADPKQIQELVTIVGNLVDNALDAVGAAPVKRIDVACRYDEGNLLIEVADTGPGVEEGRQEALFTKGYSTKAANRGWGLFLVRQSLERAGGTVEVQSKPGEGARFIVVLPYQSKGDRT
ncbi:signal transduction histidine kinase sporulation regulator spoob [Lucifera butyrica]|uniref:histidine kinase n=1 Tax=Lucifera butyrica TaxID=1351585 RepID=A0A498RAQ0_9FIRM|nr:DcuS/MalK family sensor histidine kinase [Lucifera butyrica]VBB09816.1 signal transduction histidine kinase sporulation regulator spoob [Lucifera butyrica]